MPVSSLGSGAGPLPRETPRPVALIGVGLLGTALAERLLGAGFTVSGFDVDPGRQSVLVELGGTAAGSAAEAAAGAGIVLTCLMSGEIVRDAVLGPGGAAEAMDPSTILLDVSTTAPAETRRLAEELGRQGIPMLDSPVSGSSAMARRGELLAMIGGPADAFERCRPVLAAFAGRAVHLGPNGAGATAKLVTNLVLGLNRLALAEGLALGLRAGLEGGVLLELLGASAAYSRALDAKGERMVTGRFEPEARLEQHLKDVRLILELGEELGTSLPLSELHASLLEEGVRHGLGGLDNSAIIEVLRGMPFEQHAESVGE